MRCSPPRSSAAIWSWRSAAAWSATSPALPRRSCAAASITCRCRPRCWRRSIPRSAARPRSTPATARTWSARSTSRSWWWPTRRCSTRLPEREFRAGYAEVVKYGLLGDADFFDWLDANWRDVFAGGPAREHAIAVSCRAKAAIVARDERETGDRMLLNLGHTFGHAFEAAAGFLRPAAARRGGRARHGAGVRVLGAARPDCHRPRPTASSRILRRSACRPMSKPCPAATGRRRRDDGPDRAGQEGQARPAHLHPGARHRPGLRHPRRRCRRGPRLPRRKARSRR